MLRKKFLWSAGVLVPLMVIAVWLVFPRGVDSSTASFATFNVDNLSCGSCVKNIQNALKAVDGVGKVDVSVTAGRSQVEFDSARVDANRIAREITSAGYPAKVREVLSPQDYQALKDESGRLGRLYIARIGDRLLPREEFEAKVRSIQAGLKEPVEPQALEQIRLQVWRDQLQQELLLSSAEASEVVVQDGEVQVEIDKIKSGHPGFEELAAKRFGSMDAFATRIKNDLVIRRHLEKNVLPQGLDEVQRQQMLEQWYRELVQNTPVVIFDPAIKAATAGGGSGCGGSCCG